MDDVLSAVPASALRYTTDRDTLQLDTTKETLSKAPHFKADQWPDFNQPGYARDVYRAYNVQPYFTTDGTTEADDSRRYVRDREERTPATRQPDNTARNVRDRDDQTLTPFNQGNSKADVDTTAKIRKEITAADGMSVNAQNVKVITQNGRVTLRGPVKTAEEKRLIGEIANRIATSGNVDNQLEVKLTTSDDK
ncbi:MAG: BON domain-containing protein [Verrucomicrobia bacterium]|nr:BON domain-containing protein [Verrucomicrobiota bacterium]